MAPNIGSTLKRRGCSVLLLSVFLLASTTSFGQSSIVDPSDAEAAEAFESESNNGIYRVSIRPEAGSIGVGKMQRWIVQLMSADGEPVYPARMSVGGGMAEHKHGLPTQPQLVAYGGDGVYLIDGVRFNMAGAWRLSFVIESEHGVDQVDFDIDVQF